MTEISLVQSTAPPQSRGTGAIDPYAGSAARQWWLVFCLLFLMMLGTIDRQIVSLLVNPIKEDLGLTDTQISIVYGAAFAIANMAFTLPAGYFADRLNRRLLVGLGATVWSVMTLFCGMASNYWQLLWTRAGGGFGEGVIGPCSMSMLRSALSPERRGRGFSVFSMASMTGSALALVVGGALIGIITESGITSLPLVGEVAPWQIVLILIGAVGTPLGLLMLTVYEPIRDQSGTDGSGATFREAMKYIAGRWKLYLPLFAYQALYGLSALSFGAWIAAMIGRSYGLSIPQIGATLGLMMLILPAIGLWLTGTLLDRFNKKNGVAGMCIIGLAISFVYWLTAWTAPLAPTLLFFWPMLAVHMLLSGAPPAIGATIIASVTPANVMGRVSAVQLFIYGFVAAAIGPIIVALVSDNIFEGPRSLAYALSLVTCVYGLGTLVMLFAVWRKSNADGLNQPA